MDLSKFGVMKVVKISIKKVEISSYELSTILMTRDSGW